MADPRSPLAAVPTLDAIAADLSKLDGLPAEAIRGLTLRCAAVLAALASVPAVAPTTTPKTEPDEWISEPSVMERFGLTRGWLRRHRRLLRSRRALSTPSRKLSLYHAARVRRLLEERTALSP